MTPPAVLTVPETGTWTIRQLLEAQGSADLLHALAAAPPYEARTVAEQRAVDLLRRELDARDRRRQQWAAEAAEVGQ